MPFKLCFITLCIFITYRDNIEWIIWTIKLKSPLTLFRPGFLGLRKAERGFVSHFVKSLKMVVEPPNFHMKVYHDVNYI